MRLGVIIPDGLAVGHFATDAIAREMTDWEVNDPVDVEELVGGSKFELEALKEEGGQTSC